MALPLSIQPEFLKVGLRGTIGAVVHLSYENNLASENYNARVDNDYILTAAHVAYLLFHDEIDIVKYKSEIDKQIQKFNESNFFATFTVEPTKMDYALLPCNDNFQENSALFDANFGHQYGNLNNWQKIWPSLLYFASKNCQVCKKGKRTDITYGKLLVYSSLNHGMYEVVNDNNDFSENGDSGSLVFLIVPDNWPVEAK
jgi:hypothetical protein